MSARKGFVRPAGLMGCLLAVALLASSLLATTASAKEPPSKPSLYIALGDSISFGYSQQKFAEHFPTEPITAYEGSGVERFGAKLAKKQAKEGYVLSTQNLACPGERSTGMIGNGPLGTFLESLSLFNDEGDPACTWHNTTGFARHTEYGSVSQVEYAKGLVESGTHVAAVTINIGSNDELKVVAECNSEAYRIAHGYPALFPCVTGEAPGLFAKILHNIGVSISVLREAGYTGRIVLLGFYNPQAFILEGSDTLQKALNTAAEGAIATNKFGPGVVYANPFPKINGGHGERAKICKYTEECNEFDKKLNLISQLEKEGKTKTEAEELISEFPELVKSFPLGDIHPTPAGYEQIAKIMWKAFRS